MAESGSGKGLGRAFTRKVTRTKEKVLQNFGGKADRTRDEDLEKHIASFNDQQVTAARLQKDLKHYMACVKEMSLASQAMYRSIKENYEPDWIGYTEVSSAEVLTSLWTDYLNKLGDKLQTPLGVYTSHFPEMKAKIAKRGRKLTDYDSARRNHEASVGSKKSDKTKIDKAAEDLNEAKFIYESINAELREELPALYQSRISFLASYFNSLFTMEAIFDRESSKLKELMAEMSGKLCEDAGRCGQPWESFRPKSVRERRSSMDRPRGNDSMRVSTNHNSPALGRQSMDISGNKGSGVRTSTPMSVRGVDSASTSPPRSHPPVSLVPGGGDATAVNGRSGGKSNNLEVAASREQRGTGRVSQGTGQASQGTSSLTSTTAADSDDDSDSDSEDDTLHYSHAMRPSAANAAAVGGAAQQSSTANSSSAVPAHRVLFQVVATHRYEGDDADELTFEQGEVITVVPFDDPEDQDDGWLAGIKESTREKGVFPENFTRRL